mgnify:CR=1 FL=1
MFVTLVLQVKLIENFSEGSAGAMSISNSHVVINGADNFVQNNTGADSSGAFSVEDASQLEIQGSMCATGSRAGTGGVFAGIVQVESPGASLVMAAGSNVKLADNTPIGCEESHHLLTTHKPAPLTPAASLCVRSQSLGPPFCLSYQQVQTVQLSLVHCCLLAGWKKGVTNTLA